MDATKPIVFAATVLPLVCTPGPDLIYIEAQALAGGRTAALRASAEFGRRPLLRIAQVR